jgi:hypothetical protein
MVNLGDRVSGQFLDGGGAVFNVRHDAFGAVGDGVTSDDAAFAAAEASGDQCYAPAGTYRITVNLTLAKAWTFARGAKLSIASGVTVTMHELPDAGNWQVFDGEGGVLFTGSAAGAVVNARWFGAVPGDTTLVAFSQNVGSSLQYAVTQQTRSGVAFARALDSLSQAGGTLYIPAGLYWTYAYTVVDVDNVAIRGDGSDKTILRTLASAPSTHGYGVIQMGHSHASRVTAGPFERMSIEGITVDGNIQNRADPTSRTAPIPRPASRCTRSFSTTPGASARATCTPPTAGRTRSGWPGCATWWRGCSTRCRTASASVATGFPCSATRAR